MEKVVLCVWLLGVWLCFRKSLKVKKAVSEKRILNAPLVAG